MEDHPVIEEGCRWLKANMPTVDRISVVHGDLRSGNFLFEPNSGRIVAFLDWELGHLGDFHEDLAFATLKTFLR